MTGVPRVRRTRRDLRRLLIDAALEEFGAKGFDGASTRSIARRADAHQPQINYHFESKDALYEEAVDHLFTLLHQAIGDLPQLDEDTDPVELGAFAAETIRRFVQFAAAHPELNQIMVHGATEDSDRLRRTVGQHVRPIYDWIRGMWVLLGGTGLAAPVDPTMVHYVIVGAASLPFVNAPEARLLTGVEPTDPDWVHTHAEGIVAMLLPGLGRHSSPPPVTEASASP